MFELVLLSYLMRFSYTWLLWYFMFIPFHVLDMISLDLVDWYLFFAGAMLWLSLHWTAVEESFDGSTCSGSPSGAFLWVLSYRYMSCYFLTYWYILLDRGRNDYFYFALWSHLLWLVSLVDMFCLKSSHFLYLLDIFTRLWR